MEKHNLIFTSKFAFVVRCKVNWNVDVDLEGSGFIPSKNIRDIIIIKIVIVL